MKPKKTLKRTKPYKHDIASSRLRKILLYKIRRQDDETEKKQAF